MISNIPENEDRIFIIRVYLMDDTISIYELAKRNSGKRFFPYYYYQFNVIIKILNITVIKFGSIILISPLSYAGKKDRGLFKYYKITNTVLEYFFINFMHFSCNF